MDGIEFEINSLRKKTGKEIPEIPPVCDGIHVGSKLNKALKEKEYTTLSLFF